MSRFPLEIIFVWCTNRKNVFIKASKKLRRRNTSKVRKKLLACKININIVDISRSNVLDNFYAARRAAHTRGTISASLGVLKRVGELYRRRFE